jgi:hypothetical protein
MHCIARIPLAKAFDFIAIPMGDKFTTKLTNRTNAIAVPRSPLDALVPEPDMGPEADELTQSAPFCFEGQIGVRRGKSVSIRFSELKMNF